MIKGLLKLVGTFFAIMPLLAVESPNFVSKPLMAGKALLAENGFIVQRDIGVANFPPELRLPIQLVYSSANQKTGIFGFGWSSPQLESCAYYDKDGMLWTTPWGEKIKFFAKNEKLPKDAIKIELFEHAKKGRGFYSPYSNWEATTSASRSRLKSSGNWIISGKNDYKGWVFVYRDARLRSITAPSGRSIVWGYNNGRLASISCLGKAFVSMEYANNQVVKLSVNGVEHRFSYSKGQVQVMPMTLDGGISHFTRPRLMSFQTANLLPETYSYDEVGYLCAVKRGDAVEIFDVEHETVTERHTNLRSAERKSKVKHSGKVAGRLLKDRMYSYSYRDGKIGKVTITDALKRKSSYDYDAERGIFKIQEFSGKSFTVYYFMRYDVAYLGKVRKIMDGRNRTVASYRYDKLTGKVIRFRDLAENDLNFAYDDMGRLIRISRRAADQETPEPVRSYNYGTSPLPTRISQLNARGQVVTSVEISYNEYRQPIRISDGRRPVTMLYSRDGYPVMEQNAFGLVKRTAYDDLNRVISKTDEYGVKFLVSYSPAGLISKIERRDGAELLSSMQIEYDGFGRPMRYVDHAGRVKVLERDQFGRVLKEVFPDNTSVGYTYDVVGNLHKVLDQNNNTITFDWGKYGIGSKRTATGQLTDYVHDKFGLLSRIYSLGNNGQIDRSIEYEYDKLDRIVKVNYGNGEIEERTYDSWGKLLTSKRGDANVTFKYDYFGRIVEKRENDITTRYSYNKYGQRIGRSILRNGNVEQEELRSYDKFGRLTSITSQGKTVEFHYNARNQLEKQVVDGRTILFSYTKYGQLRKKTLLKK